VFFATPVIRTVELIELPSIQSADPDMVSGGVFMGSVSETCSDRILSLIFKLNHYQQFVSCSLKLFAILKPFQ
jgi:hypothetical protein